MPNYFDLITTRAALRAHTVNFPLTQLDNQIAYLLGSDVKRRFNAVGNGVASDTDAFLEGIATTSAEGIPLFVPQGSYRIEDNLFQSLGAGNVSIVGEGWNTVLLADFGSNTNVNLFKTPLTGERVFDLQFRNFRVQAQTSHTPNTLFLLNRATRVLFENIYRERTDVPGNATDQQVVFIDCYSGCQHVEIVGCVAHGGGATFVRGAWTGAGNVTGTITGAADNGSGAIRITDAAHGLKSGDSIHIEGVTGTVEANGSWDSVEVINANTFDLIDSTFTNAYVSGGTWVLRTYDVRIHHNNFHSIDDEPIATWGGYGMLAEVSIDHNNVWCQLKAAGVSPAISFGDGVSDFPQATGRLQNLICDANNVRADGNGIVLTRAHTSGQIENARVTDNNVMNIGGAHAGTGIQEVITGAGTIRNVSFDGNNVSGFGTGINGTTITANDNNLYDCGTPSLQAFAALKGIGNTIIAGTNSPAEGLRCRASGEYIGNTVDGFTDGIKAATMSNVKIIGNTVKNSTRGINLTGAGSGAIVQSNDVSENNTTPINISTHTPRSVKYNVGYTSEAEGTGTINSGATNTDITHGLSATPQARDIKVIFTELATNDPGQIYITNITGTQFRVNVRNNPGASNLDFSWSASLYP